MQAVLKKCNACQADKPESEYYSSRYGQCIVCHRAEKRRVYREKNGNKPKKNILAIDRTDKLEQFINLCAIRTPIKTLMNLFKYTAPTINSIKKKYINEIKAKEEEIKLFIAV